MAISETDLDTLTRQFGTGFKLRPENRTRDFGTFKELNEYWAAELAFWNTIPVNEIAASISRIRSQLSQAAQTADQRTATGAIRESFQSAEREQVIDSTTAFAKLLQTLAKTAADAATAAYSYSRNTLNQNNAGDRFLRSKFGLAGLVTAVVFENPNLFPGRAAAEVEAYAQQRNEITAGKNSFIEFQAKAAEEQTALKDDAAKWIEQRNAEATTLLETNRQFLQTEFRKWADKFNTDCLAWQDQIDTLKKLYEEKLRLQEPAAYWNTLDKSYVKQGRFWVAGIAVVVLALARWVSVLVYQPPAILTSDKFTLGGFKAAVLITAVISATLYLLTLSVRVATSSYHLARDARERYNLTHVFLALVKDNAIEIKDREIILTALFSRSDTGLLKHDGGPTMPPTPLGSILTQITGSK